MKSAILTKAFSSSFFKPLWIQDICRHFFHWCPFHTFFQLLFRGWQNNDERRDSLYVRYIYRDTTLIQQLSSHVVSDVISSIIFQGISFSYSMWYPFQGTKKFTSVSEKFRASSWKWIFYQFEWIYSETYLKHKYSNANACLELKTAPRFQRWGGLNFL